MTNPQTQRPLDRATCLVVALVLTFAARAIPEWDWLHSEFLAACGGSATSGAIATFQAVLLIVMSLSLCLCAPRRSGLGFGSIRENWRRVVLINSAPIVLAMIVYPKLAERPFSGSHISSWTLSPLGQDMMFAGFLYGFLGLSFPGLVHRSVPLDKALLLAAAFFGLWHLPNLQVAGDMMSTEFVWFQVLYTSLGAATLGMSRQWTGSMWYGLVPHCVNNCIAAHF